MSIVDRAIESTKNRIHYILNNAENGSEKHCIKAENQVEIQNYILGLLQKEIAKSPIVYTENEFTDADGNRGMKVTYIECPNCRTEIDELRGFPRCIECGQRIEWNN